MRYDVIIALHFLIPGHERLMKELGPTENCIWKMLYLDNFTLSLKAVISPV